MVKRGSMAGAASTLACLNMAGAASTLACWMQLPPEAFELILEFFAPYLMDLMQLARSNRRIGRVVFLSPVYVRRWVEQEDRERELLWQYNIVPEAGRRAQILTAPRKPKPAGQENSLASFFNCTHASLHGHDKRVFMIRSHLHRARNVRDR